ncbi:MAG TPA: type III secretion system export apparatus subunit SctU [Chlamydiales bacterium]|nr:MAG: EscU/YscU/HrcU family type III secretion system export apparatus switch protein [Verrucomicrobia bacterium RIFCSPHIGHO2_12_FULL_41_10]HLB53259.1 type III secretion system export apparatus subunit SctU [Chlamydiales bacterium]
MAEKTEKATPKKLKDARKKGQVAKIQDVPAAITFVVSMGGTLAMMGFFFNQIASFFLSILRSVPTVGSDFTNRAVGYFGESLNLILATSFPIMLLVSLVGVLVSFLVVGPVFSFEAMKFDLKKLNPIEGIKQKFKIKTLVELLKSIAKISGAALIIFLIIWRSIPQIVSTTMLPVLGSAMIVYDFLINTTIQVGIFFLLIALFDLAFQKKNFAKEMMMQKFEVKQEYKDTEGDPMIKGRRREMFREIAYQEGPSAAKRARAIITNPTHIAVALKYNREEEPAPRILTMGVGAIASQIIKIGVENNIPIMRNVDLARNLYAKGKISEYIPEEFYPAVAEIIKWIEALENNPDVNQELFR